MAQPEQDLYYKKLLQEHKAAIAFQVGFQKRGL